jgi:hypothetical protein
MKLSKYLTLTALALSVVSVATYAQTSQTYHFGEGQTTLPPGNAHPTRPAAGASAQAQQQPAPASQPQPKAKSNHKPNHHHHYRHHAPAQDMYSRS